MEKKPAFTAGPTGVMQWSFSASKTYGSQGIIWTIGFVLFQRHASRAVIARGWRRPS
jgi:hypothetical protein